MNVHFDKRNGVIVSHLRARPGPRRQSIREYLVAIVEDLPDEIRWLTDCRALNVRDIDYAGISDAFGFRRALCGKKKSFHVFLCADVDDMLTVGIMNQIVSMAGASIPKATALMTTDLDEALSALGVDELEPETAAILDHPQSEPVEKQTAATIARRRRADTLL